MKTLGIVVKSKSVKQEKDEEKEEEEGPKASTGCWVKTLSFSGSLGKKKKKI